VVVKIVSKQKGEPTSSDPKPSKGLKVSKGRAWIVRKEESRLAIASMMESLLTYQHLTGSGQDNDVKDQGQKGEETPCEDIDFHDMTQCMTQTNAQVASKMKILGNAFPFMMRCPGLHRSLD
jgi:hypothetical protein